MSTLSLGTRARIAGFSRYIEAMPYLVQLFEAVEVWARHLGTDNLDNLAVTTPKIADGAVTTAKTAEGVARITTGQYTGDGLANREINLGFRAKRVWVIDHTNSIIYESVGDALTAFMAGYRSSAGVWTGSDTTNWQGVSTNGFKCGTGAANSSNTSGRTYTYYAEK